MRKVILCFFLISSVFLTGCYGYKDINNVVFATSIIVDIDKQNNPVVYLEIFQPAKTASKSQEKAERIMLKGTGKTVFEALNDANLASSYKIDYSQNKAIIYTKRAAENGIGNYFDIFRRDSQFIIRPFMAVYDGDVDRLAKGNFVEEQFVGFFLSNLIDNIGSSSRTVQSSLNHFLSLRVSPEKTDVLTLIKVSEDEPTPTLIVEGGAIIKNDKLKSMLPKTEGEAYNFLTDQVKIGSMEVNDPKNKDKYISLRIQKSKTNTEIRVKGSKIQVTKKIKVKASIVETENYTNLTEEELKKIQTGAEKNLITACNNVFNKYKKQNLDIFLIGSDLENKYGSGKVKNISNVIKETTLEVKPEVFIDSPGKARAYK